MSSFSFLTIKTASEGTYKEKGSKFLAFAIPVESELEIKAKIAELKKKYFDARHHSFAYILGADKAKFRAFDDGEPNHSAGDPILGQIKSKNLTNVLIVVVRYFGGTKLGVGGLIQAYKTAAEEALLHANIIEKEVMANVTLRYPYEATPEVMRLVKEFELEISAQEFGGDCFLTGLVRVRNQKQFVERLILLQALGNKIVLG
ncbi:MAG: YigZ family protein [Bacteroidia bacterium]|nr:YigZ family protein [Bacteroidia bacterium]